MVYVNLVATNNFKTYHHILKKTYYMKIKFEDIDMRSCISIKFECTAMTSSLPQSFVCRTCNYLKIDIAISFCSSVRLYERVGLDSTISKDFRFQTYILLYHM